MAIDPAHFSYSLPAALAAAVDTVLDNWQQHDKVRQLWARDAGLWTGHDEADWLGWLDVPATTDDLPGDLRSLEATLAGGSYRQVVLLGMGGSSMAPEVIHATLGARAGYPELIVLDSTDPAQVGSVDDRIDLQHTLFLVASKSGSTLEPNILQAYFFHRAVDALGAALAAACFIAITDPGSNLEQLATAAGFRHIFHGKPDIGGRFSVLSNFGMVPAMLTGVDVQRLLGNAHAMVAACAPGVPVRDNPGVLLGCILGVAAGNACDKLTLVASPGIATIGAWLEQLLGESTGKQGKGIIPVDGEPLGEPGVYGNDRVFVYLRLESAPDAAQDAAVARLERAGQPVVRIIISDAWCLGQEFFRWEIATAVAGAVLGINPFDQPDVEASKAETRKLTAAYEAGDSLPADTPLVTGDGMALYTDPVNAAALAALVGEEETVRAYLQAHLGRADAGDYVALLAYLERNTVHAELLQALRTVIRNSRRVATCTGFGPRFLHSTGQAYKGGKNSGVFLQITCEDAVDLPVPGRGYSFGIVKAAQAQGDFAVLAERGRRVLRVQLGTDSVQGLEQLLHLVTGAVRDN